MTSYWLTRSKGCVDSCKCTDHICTKYSVEESYFTHGKPNKVGDCKPKFWSTVVYCSKCDYLLDSTKQK